MITTTLTTTIMSSTINTMNNTCIDHFQWLEVFHQNYQRIHVYLCLLLCPIGVIANTLNVVVLCQARLRSPTNLLLSVLAVSDGFVMFIYIIFDYFYLMTPRLTDGMTKAYAQLLLINIVLQNLFHAFSAWIIVAVAIFRLIYIKTGVRAAIYCNMFKAWIVILLVLISSILLTIPFMIAHQVRIKSNDLPTLTSLHSTQNFIDNTMNYQSDVTSTSTTTTTTTTTGYCYTII
ncbi:dro myosuppressin receptor isoform 1 [Schistosoma japonicum]|uniref:Dro myosuppressin receptor isoform 1 n=1 Tax=Schistosoma japonicum TaxID=6182 RepID=A0A4Z2D0W0_SCHJA|nr:dro myosuppressin receptor isoform 1 [Schistosoma japonicum]